jgi:hypothetical protein
MLVGTPDEAVLGPFEKSCIFYRQISFLELATILAPGSCVLSVVCTLSYLAKEQVTARAVCCDDEECCHSGNRLAYRI